MGAIRDVREEDITRLDTHGSGRKHTLNVLARTHTHTRNRTRKKARACMNSYTVSRKEATRGSRTRKGKGRRKNRPFFATHTISFFPPTEGWVNTRKRHREKGKKILYSYQLYLCPDNFNFSPNEIFAPVQLIRAGRKKGHNQG